ncbi:3'-5' exonuclease [Dyadobacter sediminis]|uniref:3'-5' exonuclease n=1 Tax=Dyadobacter sediminis TaxID=1493691 RepID=A0A5R9K898_9BACT|nr:3'-5' exonuclease [Dyadobacter sediminis]TLU90039.1 3'-5' exonuclease [Dyadobacter sediminis]GGC10682.1 3'-5' exonuclease [Dyadobacter sediminis]
MTEEFKKKAKSLLLLDIETVAACASYDELPERMQKLWDKKAVSLKKGDDTLSNAEYFYNRSAIYSEFGKIICIAFGAFYWNEKNEIAFKVSSFSGDNEAEVLLQFRTLIEKYPSDQLILCAHNGKEFDFPFICRRMLIHGIEIPKALQISGKKPWEILHQDTMDMWKFGDYKSYTSLDLLAAVFDIPGSKNEMSGDQVTKVYYEENDLLKISRYCREDVVVMAQLYLRLQNFETVHPDNIIRVE